MFQYDANISMLYADLPLPEGASLARSAGFGLVEMWWPSPAVLRGDTAREVAARVRAQGVACEQVNLFGGDTEAGDRGLLTDAHRATEFRATLPEGIDVATRLGAQKVHVLSGRVAAGVSRAEAHAEALIHLRYAADLVRPLGMTVLVEPLNRVDVPDYLLSDVPAALEMIRLADRPNIALQLDVYHVAMGGGDPVDEIFGAADHIGHVQLADFPGRHEPGTGSLDFVAILRALAQVGYRGAIGLEFEPALRNRPDFGFLAQWRSLARPG